MTETCLTCRFWLSSNNPQWTTADDVGDCRRHAPVTPLIVRTVNESYGSRHGEWPRVYGRECCGDYES